MDKLIIGRKIKKTIGIALLLVIAGYGFAQTGEVPNDMVRINGGTFTMGSPANEPGRDDDEIQRQVTVSSFYMGKYEVTQKEYREVMGTTVRQQSEKAGDSTLYGEGDNYPMYYVSWFEAVEYCNKRSQQEGLTPAYTINGINVTWNRNANGYRLPTEAEWEYACRAGTTTAYNTGASITDDTGWYAANSGDKTHSVGQKPANAWGLYDMHGNVWEWCWDWYGDYPSGAQSDPAGASSGSIRVRRGGSWPYAAQYARSAYRGSFTPSLRFAFLGFRLVRPAPSMETTQAWQTDPTGTSSESRRVGRGGSWDEPARIIRSANRFNITPSFRGGRLGFRLARNGQ